MKPKMIVCLGRISAMRLISPDFKITKDHGVFYKKGNFLITAVYHPSALLRDVGKRPEAFDDLMSLRAKMRELSIL